MIKKSQKVGKKNYLEKITMIIYLILMIVMISVSTIVIMLWFLYEKIRFSELCIVSVLFFLLIITIKSWYYFMYEKKNIIKMQEDISNLQLDSLNSIEKIIKDNISYPKDMDNLMIVCVVGLIVSSLLTIFMLVNRVYSCSPQIIVTIGKVIIIDGFSIVLKNTIEQIIKQELLSNITYSVKTYIFLKETKKYVCIEDPQK